MNHHMQGTSVYVIERLVTMPETHVLQIQGNNRYIIQPVIDPDDELDIEGYSATCVIIENNPTEAARLRGASFYTTNPGPGLEELRLAFHCPLTVQEVTIDRQNEETANPVLYVARKIPPTCKVLVMYGKKKSQD